MRLYGVGNVIIDLTLPVPTIPGPGQDMIADGAEYQVGGTYNTLVAAVRHGLASVYAGAHGTGPFGDRAREGLREAGIGLAHAPTPGLDTGFDVALTQRDGERSFVTVFGAEAELSAAQLQTLHPEVGDIVYVSGYGLLPRTNADAIAQWLTVLPSQILVLVDPGPLVAQIPPAVWRTVEARSSWLSCNRTEATILTGIDDPSQAAIALGRKVAHVVVRDGAAGAWLCLDGAAQLVEGIAVKVVDTNGAGDAHCGSLMAALARGESPERAVRIANACAALAVTRFGPATAPTLAQTLAALD